MFSPSICDRLLNRTPTAGLIADLQSVLNDLTVGPRLDGCEPDAADDRDRVCRQVERAVLRFDPRLVAATVRVAEYGRGRLELAITLVVGRRRTAQRRFRAVRRVGHWNIVDRKA